MHSILRISFAAELKKHLNNIKNALRKPEGVDLLFKRFPVSVSVLSQPGTRRFPVYYTHTRSTFRLQAWSGQMEVSGHIPGS